MTEPVQAGNPASLALLTGKGMRYDELQDTPEVRAWLDSQAIPRCAQNRLDNADPTDGQPAAYCVSAYCVRCAGYRSIDGVPPELPNAWMWVANGQPVESDSDEINSPTLTEGPPSVPVDSADNMKLSKPKRKRDMVKEFRGFTRRIVRAYGRRVADKDIGALADLADLASHVDDAIREACNALHAAGYSWTDIGVQLGVSRQAARQRWANKSEPSN